MCMWQSHALAGALSFGASVPAEYGTCCALAPRMPRLLAAVVIASTLAAFIKSRRSVDRRSMEVLGNVCSEGVCGRRGPYELRSEPSRCVPSRCYVCGQNPQGGQAR